MHKPFFLFAILIAMPTSAAEAIRCGTDAFGNEVCMDKDGVVRAAPDKPAGDRSSGADKGKSAAGESGRKPGGEDQTGKTRCGIDPFGNTVCR
ncbi:MAG: hypothetical protein HZB47_07790 [Nitrosomonadales bacterium]|nr:hypothetical protein [Nitrosomonadales bacterium]